MKGWVIARWSDLFLLTTSGFVTCMVAGSLPPHPPPSMVLDQANGWYIVGSLSTHHVLHTISLTLSHPQCLHQVNNKGSFAHTDVVLASMSVDFSPRFL